MPSVLEPGAGKSLPGRSGQRVGIGPCRVFAAASEGCQRPERQAPQAAAKLHRHVAQRLAAGTTGGHERFRARPIQYREFAARPGRLVASVSLHLRPPESRGIARSQRIRRRCSRPGRRAFIRCEASPCLVVSLLHAHTDARVDPGRQDYSRTWQSAHNHTFVHDDGGSHVAQARCASRRSSPRPRSYFRLATIALPPRERSVF
jgi:hypothetical protein